MRSVRLRIHMVVIGLLACPVLSSWAQQQQEQEAVSSSRHSYSDRLKAAAGTDTIQANSESSSFAVYEDQLRRLSDGNTKNSDNAVLEQATSSPAGGPDDNRLKASLEVLDKKQAPTTDASRESYQKQLRRLANDDATGSSDEQPYTGSSSNPGASINAETHSVAGAPTGDENKSATQVRAINPESSSHNENSVSSPVPSPTQQRSSFGCIDTYCKQLGGIATGTALPTVPLRSPETRNITTERNFLKNLAFDQMSIWSSPFRMHDSDATWAVPFGIVVGSLIATDRDLSKQLVNPDRIDTSKKISDFGLYSFIGAGAGFYGLGLITHDDHKRETGLLSGESFINATLVAEALKLAFGRQRPFEADHFGHIGKGGSSFPSGHAIDSWSIATVFAHEYPSPFMKIAAYGLASTVSIARITANQHYASDVLVGSTFGYLIGQKIYKDHHNPELPGAEYGTFVTEKRRDPAHSGSAYVPLESWVYPVIDRLAALGLVKTNFDSERPFTRLECARLAREAEESTQYYDAPPDVQSVIDSLQKEFSRELEVWAGGDANRSGELESIYTRATEIAGPVLRDGYYFGQTLYNDYGRPYARGFNNVTGFSARGTSGPLVFYFRGEYQHAPQHPDYTSQQKALLSSFNFGVPQLPNPFPAVDRFQVLDAYMGLNLAGNQLTLGQQSLWWGPGTSGPFIWSNNAEPLKMARLTNTSPIKFPLLSRFLGPFRYDIFFGQTDGYHFMFVGGKLLGPGHVKQPFVHGQRFTFKPTPNFEFGFTRTSIFGGTGYPLTSSYLFRALFSTSNPLLPGDPRKPGYEQSDFDLTYRVPGLRDWLTFYWDEYSKDEISPLFFPRRSAQRAGIYLARFPGVKKVDLRVEGVYTDPPGFGVREGPVFFYSDITYTDAYRNNGNLLGSWIGRNGRGVYAVSTVWLSPRNTLQFGYREATVDRSFVMGGRYQDINAKASFDVASNLSMVAMVQSEHWHFPALNLNSQNNFVSSVQITYSPRWKRSTTEESH